MQTQRLDWLQSLRAIAALTVVFFHAKDLFPAIPWLQKLLSQGFVGVDVFFCLSGYIICQSCANKPINIQSGIGFIVNRFIRVFSGYWPVLALTVLASWGGVRVVQNLGDKALSSLFLTSTDLNQNALEVAWTLSYELRFYLVFALIYFFFKRGLSRAAVLGLLTVITAYNLYLYALHFNTTVGGVWPLRNVLNGFYLEFMFGIVVFLIRQRTPFSLAICGYLPFASVLLIAAGAFNPHFANFEFLRACTYGLAACLMLAFFIALQDARGGQSPHALIRIGDASFSLYLLHPLLLHGFAAIGWRLGWNGTLWYGLACVALITLASCLWFMAIERPVLRTLQVLGNKCLPTKPNSPVSR